MNDTNIQVGAYGWRHAHWKSSFYPDDMPDDWRLSYYSNVFNTVLVPADYWQAEEGFDCDEWLDDIHDTFRFYIECPVSALCDDEAFSLFIKQLQRLQSHLAGIMLPVQLVSPVNIDRLAEIQRLAPLFASPGLSGLEIKPIWQAGSSESESPAQLAIFKDDLTQLRQTRVQVEAFVNQGGGDVPGKLQQAIIVKHERLSADDLMKFRSVIEIMGL